MTPTLGLGEVSLYRSVVVSSLQTRGRRELPTIRSSTIRVHKGYNSPSSFRRSKLYRKGHLQPSGNTDRTTGKYRSAEGFIVAKGSIRLDDQDDASRAYEHVATTKTAQQLNYDVD